MLKITTKKLLMIILAAEMLIHLCPTAAMAEETGDFAYILIEAETGIVLEEHNSDVQMNAGSMTKLMSLLLVAEDIETGKYSLDTELTASQSVQGTKGTVIWLEPGDKLTADGWGIWSPWWQENWVWVENWQKCWHTDRWTDSEGKVHRDRWYRWVDNGWWEDQGWWEFDYNGYSASLSATMDIPPDSLSPSPTATTLKSGYGIQERVTARVTTTQSSAVTAAQNAVTYFPEFGYEGFWRLLKPSISGKRSTFTFKENPYSTYDRPTHFTPIWYPDGSYTPYTWLLDCWTPAGMLSMNLTDSVRISGDLWEEWHIAPSE